MFQGGGMIRVKFEKKRFTEVFSRSTFFSVIFLFYCGNELRLPIWESGDWTPFETLKSREIRTVVLQLEWSGFYPVVNQGTSLRSWECIRLLSSEPVFPGSPFKLKQESGKSNDELGPVLDNSSKLRTPIDQDGKKNSNVASTTGGMQTMFKSERSLVREFEDALN